ncbi:MAG: nucleotidyltransferase family protein [Dehalococcoidales bacterium]|nr:MAG: nucleotidyltransferase family protein [Dehalococcoidales bacterium]
MTHRNKRQTSSSTHQRAAREVLLLCTTANISPEGKERLSRILAEGLDWEYLLNLAEFHNITPLVAHNLTTNGSHSQVPQPYSEQLNRIYNNTLYRNVTLSNELVNVMSALKKDDITTISLKGTVLAEVLYENPALRAIADIDILVHPEDVSRAGAVLIDLGYELATMPATWEHHFHEVPYCKQAAFPFFIELHWSLEDRRFATVPEKKIWHRAQLLELQGVTTTVLSPEDNLLFLSTHLSKQSCELLKFLGDIAELLKKYEDELDWDYIVASARSWQTDIAVYYALRRAKDLLGAPVPAPVLKTLKPSPWRRWLLSILVNQEHFVTPISESGIRAWTSVLARSLMMKHRRQMLAVLSRQQGLWKRGAWLRTSFWIMLVLAAAMGRNGARVFYRQ